MYVQSKVDVTTRGQVAFNGPTTTDEHDSGTGQFSGLDRKYDVPQKINSLWSKPLLAMSDESIPVKEDKSDKGDRGDNGDKGDKDKEDKGGWRVKEVEIGVHVGGAAGGCELRTTIEKDRGK